MASQQILFAETIAGMKKAFKRKAYESDSDTEIESYTNRGHKLKRRARFAHKGQLMPTAGPGAYKETVEYAGVRRSIIHRNPPLVDDDGYEIDSDDDESRVVDAMLSAAELNPYANIRLEHILAPLTASTDLPSHPVLSKPFTSKTLTELVAQSCGIMHKENRSLWQVRHLWTSLCGDGTWMPCETMVGSDDIDLFSDERVAHHLTNLSKAVGHRISSPATANGETRSDNAEARGNTTEEDGLADVDVSMMDADADADADEEGHGPPKRHDTVETNDADFQAQVKTEESKRDEDSTRLNGNTTRNADSRTTPDDHNSTRQEKNAKGSAAPSEDVQIQIQQDVLSVFDGLGESFIHPMFLPPSGAKPDRNMGLPENEADDIRRLLALYVQKQEEVCRGAARLHQGLLKAERLRKDVLHWAKAEAHCGPNRDLSDGEDWYDKEEWGLTEDLKKGQDEEEEDTVTAGKKTRNRR